MTTGDYQRKTVGKGPATPAKMESVAKLAGVSMMTVSRVLNGQSNVRLDTRKRVEEAIELLDYKPNFAARNLASAKSQFLGLAYLNPSSGYLGQFLIGALSSARNGGLHLILEACSDDSADWATELVAFCRQTHLRGIILPPPLCDDPAVLHAALEFGLPVVRVSPSSHRPGMTSVRIDDYQASFELTNLLISEGHRRIGFLLGAHNQEATALRYNGFVNAMKEAQIPINEQWIKDGEFALVPALAAGLNILTQKEKPTAIFASNDDMAAGLYVAAHQLGMTIPDNLSVVGFDDQPIASSLWPGLTTIHQPIIEMAAYAVNVLSQYNEHGDSSEISRDIIFPFEVVTRGSHCAQTT